MLINKFIELFKKYVYAPHIHDYQYDRSERTYTNVMGMKATGTITIYKCKCGSLAKIE